MPTSSPVTVAIFSATTRIRSWDRSSIPVTPAIRTRTAETGASTAGSSARMSVGSAPSVVSSCGGVAR
ncbi:hypothetical protein ACQP2K_24815 [Microbispora siamensis]